MDLLSEYEYDFNFDPDLTEVSDRELRFCDWLKSQGIR